jgi:hypothetical protein
MGRPVTWALEGHHAIVVSKPEQGEEVGSRIPVP